MKPCFNNGKYSVMQTRSPTASIFNYSDATEAENLHHLGERIKRYGWVDDPDADLALAFIKATLNVQFRALFEDWTIEKIAKELKWPVVGIDPT